MRLLIVTFHEIVIKYESELKTQLVLLEISTNHNVESPRSLHVKLFIYLRYLSCYEGFSFMRLVT